MLSSNGSCTEAEAERLPMLPEREDELRIRRHGAGSTRGPLGPAKPPRPQAEPVAARSARDPSTHFEYCDSGFEPSGSPELDVLRLGALCGPSNGLSPHGKPAQLSAGSESVARLTVTSEGFECLRIVAASEASQALEVELTRAGKIVASCSLSGAGWCPALGAACDDSDGAWTVELMLQGPRRSLVAQSWTR